MDKKGSSLIELVLIIAVALILTVAATINQIRYYDTLKLDAAAQRIASDLRYAQQLVMDRASITTQFLDDCSSPAKNALIVQFFPDAYHDTLTNIDYEADSYKVQSVNYQQTPITDPATKQPFLIYLGNTSKTIPEYRGVDIVMTTLNFSLGLGLPQPNAVIFESGTGYPGTAFFFMSDQYCCYAPDFNGANPRYIQLSYKGKNRYIVIEARTGEINVQSTQP